MPNDKLQTAGMPTVDHDGLLNVHAAANYLRLNATTVRTRANTGTIPSVRLPRKGRDQIWFRRDALARYLLDNLSPDARDDLAEIICPPRTARGARR